MVWMAPAPGNSPGPAARVTLVEKIVLAFLFFLSWTLILPIPFSLFIFQNDRVSKLVKDARHILYVAFIAFFSIATTVLACIMFLSVYAPSIERLHPVPTDLWEFMVGHQEIPTALLGCTVISAIFTNRLATSMLMNEEQQFRTGRFTGWVKLKFFFTWKNERTALASGNETLLKVKNASTAVAFFGIFLAISFVVLAYMEIDVVGVLHVVTYFADFDSVAVLDYALVALFLLFFGVPFIIGNFVCVFCTGKLFSYQGHYYIKFHPLKGLVMLFLGYFVSFSPIIVLVQPIMVPAPLAGIAINLVANILTVAGWSFLVIQFRAEPNRMVLDPKVRALKCERGMLGDRGMVLAPPRLEQDTIKKACFGFLIAAIVGLCAIIGSLWFPATALYSQTTSWYEWGLYAWLGVAVVGLPITLLFFLGSAYARRALMWFLLGVMLLLLVEFLTITPLLVEFAQLFFGAVFAGRVGYTEYIDRFSGTGKPLHLFLVVIAFTVSFAAFYILKRKAIPVAISTRKHGNLSSWRNLFAFITLSPPYRSKKVHVASFAWLIVVTGITITFEPPVEVRLDYNDANDIQVSFWSTGREYTNETLAILGSYNARLYGWFNPYNVPFANRYADVNVTLVPVISMPEDQDDLEYWIPYVNNTMNFWDANNLTHRPWLGFTFDKEEMDGIARYNATKYYEAIDAVHALADFIAARGYGLYQTEYMLTINDLLDGDNEVAINNFDPIDFSWNIAHFDWMIYRSEIAIQYNEPSPYFTYEWARWIRHYARAMGGDELFSKTSMSIGVTTDDLPLYAGYDGLAEIIIDAQVCQSVGVPEIIVFILSGFLEEYGTAGLVEFMDALYGFDHVDISFNRRATFFGNLKGNENPSGSVFGFFFQDLWLDQWVENLPLIWVPALCTAPFTCILPRSGPRKQAGTPHGRGSVAPRAPIDFVLITSRVVLVVLAITISIYSVVSWTNFTGFDLGI